MKWLDEGIHISISEWMATVDAYAKDHPFTFICILLVVMTCLSLIPHYLRPYVNSHADKELL